MKPQEKAINDLYWYLKELCEATRTLNLTLGNKLPECLPFAEAAVKRYEMTYEVKP